MTFEEVLIRTIEMLQRHGRVSYRALKRQFDIDDDFLEDLKFEIIEVQKVAVDQDGVMLVWVGGSAPPAEAERRHLTVMFCDLVGYTALSGTLDPEDLREILHAYQEVTEKAVTSFDGSIGYLPGDGILIYFGYPRAHEDDALRAVRSGLRILEAIQQLNPKIQDRWGVAIAVRVGIHTGMVVAGDSRDPLAIIGETPNVAARLQSLAQPGTLVISAATYRLVGGYFECAPAGSHSVKGISGPLTVYQVLRESTARSRFDISEQAGGIPLVGRESEMAALVGHWEEARRGRSRTVLLSGEAGIGKSRLVWELKKHAAQQADAWLTECQASPYHQNSAFYPVIEVLERTILQFDRANTLEEKTARLEGFLIQYGLDLDEYVPLFASLLSLPPVAKYPATPLSPERQRQKTIEALSAIVAARSQRQPMLLVFEDLHWLDASTLELITLLIRRETTDRLLLLLTCRPEFTPPWGTHPNYSSLPLRNLPREESTAIVEQMTHGKPLPREIVRQIVEKTDGVPLFVEELTKTVLESSLLRGNYRDLVGPIPSLAIPATLHDSLIARLDRLGSVKELAQLCAALGREFDYELIEAVSSWETAALRAGLAQLVHAELLYQRGTPPAATYRFKHALIQDAAYESLLKTRRQLYHQRIAGVLEERFPETADHEPELLALHYAQAGLAAQAVPYWLRAGQRALVRAANLDAISHLTQGLEALRRLPESRERDREELEMELCLAPAYMAIKGWGAVEVEQACRRAKELSGALGDGQRLAASLWGLWTNYFLRGQMDEALATAEETQRVGLEANDPLLYAPAHHAVGYTRFSRGEYAAAVEAAQRGLERFDLEIERILVQTFQFSSSVCMRMFQATSWWMLGYPDRASRGVDAAIALAEQLNHPPTKTYSLVASCFHYQPIRNIAWVEEKAAEAIRICREEGFVLWLSYGQVFHGWARAVSGYAKEGLDEALEGLSLFRSTGSQIVLPQLMTMLGEMYWLSGKIKQAFSALEEGIREAACRNEHNMEPELHRLKGEFLLDRARQAAAETKAALWREAEDCFGKALALARGQNARILELRAATSLCRHQLEQGKSAEAFALLSGVYHWFSEGWDTEDLRQARALLETLEAAGPSA